MADDLLRALERSAAAYGDTEAMAAYLRQRVRAGELRAEMLELAAFLGHEPARRVLGSLTPEEPVPDPVRIAGGHAVHHNRSFCNVWESVRASCSSLWDSSLYTNVVRPTNSDLDMTRQGFPTCRRCLGSRRWRDHQRTAVTKWAKLVVTDYGFMVGRRVAIATVRAVVAWCQEQQRTTMPEIPFDLFGNAPPGGPSWSGPTGGMRTIEEELKQLQRSLELADPPPDDPVGEAKRIVRIVDGATLMGWSDLKERIRAEVVPWALGLDAT